MRSKQGQTSQQNQRQELRLAPNAHQILAAKLTELSVEELCARINAECEENPWLESSSSSDDYDYDSPNTQTDETPEIVDDGFDADDNYAPDKNVEAELDDDFPQPQLSSGESTRTIQDRESLSFHDVLMQQIGEYDLTEKQQKILEYLIGSLDKDGLLRLPLEQIVDELDIYQQLHTTVHEVEHVLSVLQQFDPWGVGARNLYECLLIQARKNKSLPMRNQLITLLTRYNYELSVGNWDAIARRLGLSATELQTLRKSIRKLNPRPGGSVGTTAVSDNHSVVPDFIVTIDEDGRPHFRLNEEGVPMVTLADDYDAESVLNAENVTSEKMRLEILSAQRFQKMRMEEGRLFIEALALRRRSMMLTMAAILRQQEAFFRDGDENLLRPMTLDDIAKQIHLDASTVSRVCRSKIVETPYGTFPLNWFFSSKIEKNGESLSIKHILKALKELVDKEDKQRPYSDEKLAQMLREKGYNVARRTVTKYRVQSGIPDSRLRR